METERYELKAINNEKLGFQNNVTLFVNENLFSFNQK